MGAAVFECNEKQFIGYLQRYTPEAKKRIEDYRNALANAKGAPMGPGPYAWVEANGREVKRPGDKTWILAADPEAQAILHPKCPDGSGRTVYPVLP